MSLPMVAAPKNLQLQSPLIRLPAEIKHIIYGYCFVAAQSIVDPIVCCTGGQQKSLVPIPGMTLLQTCKRIYHEVDLRQFFAQNAFRFSSANRVRTFVNSLSLQNRECVQDVEIDARRVHPDHPGLAREWLHYLAWGQGSWSQILGSLCKDAIGLKCLRLNFESWSSIPMFSIELWDLLRIMLSRLQDLERIVVIGRGVARKAPWSPVHFVGRHDVGSDDLIPRMWSAVKGSDDSKIIRWVRTSTRLQLEVVSISHLRRYVDVRWSGPSNRVLQDVWPANGSCTLLEFEQHNWDTAEGRASFSPIAAE